MKRCKKCKVEKSLSDFPFCGKNNKKHVWCSVCHNAYKREQYKTSSASRFNTLCRNKNNKPDQLIKVRSFVYTYKEQNPCADCGKYYKHYVMEFDHIAEKSKNIAAMVSSNYSINTIKKEMSKCELVCSNCHKHRTYIMVLNTYTNKQNKRKGVLYVQNYKHNKSCLDCGICYPYWVMQLDHRDRSTKKYTIAVMVQTKSLDAIKKEIIKCDLVCSNCHAERTHGTVTCLNGANRLAL